MKENDEKDALWSLMDMLPVRKLPVFCPQGASYPRRRKTQPFALHFPGDALVDPHSACAAIALAVCLSKAEQAQFNEDFDLAADMQSLVVPGMSLPCSPLTIKRASGFQQFSSFE